MKAGLAQNLEGNPEAEDSAVGDYDTEETREVVDAGVVPTRRSPEVVSQQQTNATNATFTKPQYRRIEILELNRNGRI